MRLFNPRLRAQIVKELLSVLRDPRARIVLIVPPILQLIVFSFAATLDVTNVDIAVYNRDAGKVSYELLSQIAASNFVGELKQVHDPAQLRTLLEERKVIATLDIPPTFSRDVAGKRGASVQTIVDGRRANSGQIALGYLNAIAARTGATLSTPDGRLAEPAVVRHWFNPNLIYRWFVVPGLAGILTTFIALLVTALSIAREREMGTFDQLLVSPTTTLEIIVSKTVPALVIGTVLGTFMIAAGIVAFGIPFTGSFVLLVFSLILYMLSMVGVGLMISSLSSTQQQAILGTFAAAVPMVLMSGFTTPVENMPAVLQWIAQAIPLTHFLVIVQGSFVKDLPLTDILAHLWPMAIIALVTLTGAIAFVRSKVQ